MPRTRTRVMAAGRGTGLYQGFSTQRLDVSEPQRVDKCVDSLGVHDGAFNTDHVWMTGSVNGRFPPGGTPFREFSNWVPSGLRVTAGVPISHLTIPGLPLITDAAVKALSITNPSRPAVDIPISILELKDLPDLVRDFGRGLLRRIADGNLRYQFGIKPMLSDLKKLCNFTESIDKQQRILEGFGKGPVIRKATIFTGGTQLQPNTISVVHSSPTELQFSARLTLRTTNVVRWGYVLWTPDVPEFNKSILGDANRASARRLARDIALGLTVDASTAWELMPWSWLVDWFGNMGDYLASKRSMIPVTPGIPSVCTTWRSMDHWVNTNNAAGIPHGTFSFTRFTVTKRREKASASFPSASWPLLTGRQAGILASLAALRSR